MNNNHVTWIEHDGESFQLLSMGKGWAEGEMLGRRTAFQCKHEFSGVISTGHVEHRRRILIRYPYGVRLPVIGLNGRNHFSTSVEGVTVTITDTWDRSMPPGFLPTKGEP
jgi:hypothetical protein